MTKITPKKFKEALEGSAGIITLIAKKIGCSRNAVYEYLERYPKARELYEAEAERPFDTAESVIYSKLNDPELSFEAARLLILDHKRGRARGWGKKLAIEETKSDKRITIDEIYKEHESGKSPNTTG